MKEISKLVFNNFKDYLRALPFKKTRAYIKNQLPFNIYEMLDKPHYDDVKPGILYLIKHGDVYLGMIQMTRAFLMD